MNLVCESCDARQATVYCLDCAKLHLYCQKCFKVSHESDSKQSHKIQLLSITASNKGNQGEKLFCCAHGKKPKEYACLVCKEAVCSDCLVFGEHKGHEADTIQKGFEKINKKFGEMLSECEGLLEQANSDNEKVLNNLKARIKESEEVKKTITEISQGLIAAIERKTAKSLKAIDKQISESTENMKRIQESTKKMGINIENCYDNMTKEATTSNENYYNFIKNSEDLKNFELSYNEWQSIISKSENKAPSAEHIEKYTKTVHCIINSYFKNYGGSFKEKGPFKKSNILKAADDRSLLSNWVAKSYGNSKFKTTLLWRGSADGFRASTFHAKCDDRKPTVTVVLSEFNYVFGGFTTKTWNSVNNDYVYDPKAFIFSLTHKTVHNNQKTKANSIYCDKTCGPIFGRRGDICIYDNCNINSYSYSNGNFTYDLVTNENKRNYFAGANYFRVKEIEVYSIIS
eukprot:TRINITY_DN14196_c0_g6_i4.p1 TRINITY_DN14196_c0_g6~~TRINITY_DN14196_c0_g6_i4.p1  ORF type:complete len:458 (-),score=67.90 TRINITY_DN14196_c0_g6_i4:144-1517(-)